MLRMTLSAGQHLGDGFGVGRHRLAVVPARGESLLQGQLPAAPTSISLMMLCNGQLEGVARPGH